MGSISVMDSLLPTPAPLPRILSKLERLLAINKDIYLQLVKDFKPNVSKPNVNQGFSETDTVIGARIRPLLPDEIEEGQLTGIYVRPQGGFIDVHELREKPRPPPTLSVSSLPL
jgi:kinesin family protein 2/24